LRVKHAPRVFPPRSLPFRHVFAQNYYRVSKRRRKKIFWNTVPRGPRTLVIVVAHVLRSVEAAVTRC